jgi:hypothetical protein
MHACEVPRLELSQGKQCCALLLAAAEKDEREMVSALLASAPFLPGCLALSHICRQYRTAVI